MNDTASKANYTTSKDGIIVYNELDEENEVVVYFKLKLQNFCKVTEKNSETIGLCVLTLQSQEFAGSSIATFE